MTQFVRVCTRDSKQFVVSPRNAIKLIRFMGFLAPVVEVGPQRDNLLLDKKIMEFIRDNYEFFVTFRHEVLKLSTPSQEIHITRYRIYPCKGFDAASVLSAMHVKKQPNCKCYEFELPKTYHQLFMESMIDRRLMEDFSTDNNCRATTLKEVILDTFTGWFARYRS